MAGKLKAIGAWAGKRPLMATVIVVAAVQVLAIAARGPAMLIAPLKGEDKVAAKAEPKPAAKPQPQAKSVQTAQKAPAAPVQSAWQIKRVLKIDGPYDYGSYVWDDAGVPDGPVIVTIDLKAQSLSVFRDGYEIGAAVILYGATDKPTPLGTYPISQKDADHVSNLYDAPMPYMLRLTNDGVSIHGADVAAGRATHGCIGVPTPFAKKLFNAVKLGTPVIVTDGKMLDVSGAQVGA